ncbi:hypothetical protein CC2G_003412 [Coprinopsis cinerea AmutBmut pab1-1]|nr:hypothetical protein CC2G_003412 [Coprinopsis cinerea AmutBmut pab1-1]
MASLSLQGLHTELQEGCFVKPRAPDETSICPEWLTVSGWKPEPNSRGAKTFKEANPCIIGAACVLTIFIHNNDQKLEPVGAQSGFPYRKAFQLYKKFMIEGMDLPRKNGKDQSAPFKEIFRFWNAHVLPLGLQANLLTTTKKQRNDDEDFQKAASAMTGDDDDTDNGDDCGGSDASSGCKNTGDDITEEAEEESYPDQPSARWLVDTSSIQISSNLDELRSGLADFPSASCGSDLLDCLGDLASNPAFVRQEPSAQVSKLLNRIEKASPNDIGIPAEDHNDSWGHYQFTAGEMNLDNTLTDWSDIGDVDIAARFLAAALATCHVARISCEYRCIEVDNDSYLADVYLERTVNVILTLAKAKMNSLICEKASTTLSVALNSDAHPEHAPPVSDNVKEKIGSWTVKHLREWIKVHGIPGKITKGTRKNDLITIVLQSNSVPSIAEIEEWPKSLR